MTSDDVPFEWFYVRGVAESVSPCWTYCGSTIENSFEQPLPSVIIPVREISEGEDRTKWHNTVEKPAYNQAMSELSEKRRQDALGSEVTEITAIMPKLDVDQLRQIRRVAQLLLQGHKVSWHSE